MQRKYSLGLAGLLMAAGLLALPMIGLTADRANDTVISVSSNYPGGSQHIHSQGGEAIYFHYQPVPTYLYAPPPPQYYPSHPLLFAYPYYHRRPDHHNPDHQNHGHRDHGYYNDRYYRGHDQQYDGRGRADYYQRPDFDTRSDYAGSNYKGSNYKESNNKGSNYERRQAFANENPQRHSDNPAIIFRGSR